MLLISEKDNQTRNNSTLWLSTDWNAVLAMNQKFICVILRMSEVFIDLGVFIVVELSHF